MTIKWWTMVENSLSQEIVRLRHCLAEDPNSRLFVPLAEAYLQSGMFDEAIAVLCEGIKRHPNFVFPQVMLGELYLQKSDRTAAQFRFEGVIDIAPENKTALSHLARIYKENDMSDLALATYRRLLDIDPGDQSALSALAEFEAPLGDHQERLAPSRLASEPDFNGLTEGGKHERPSRDAPDETNVDDDEATVPLIGELGSDTAIHGALGSGKAGPYSTDERSAGRSSEMIATPTLAKLYLDQGLYRQAAGIFEKLLEANPSDLENRQGLESALAKMGGESRSGNKREDALKKEAKAARLQSWLDAIQKGNR